VVSWNATFGNSRPLVGEAKDDHEDAVVNEAKET
jgi:hypothetical protein